MKPIPLIITLVLAFYTGHTQLHRRTPVSSIRVNTGLAGIHAKDPVYEAIPGKGSFEAEHNGKLLYAGNSKGKKLHGQWMSWYQNGVVRDSGRMVKGIPDGEWKFYHEDGTLQYVRTYSEDKYRRITSEMFHANPRMVLYPLTRMYKQNQASALRHLRSEYSFGRTHAATFNTLEEHVLANLSKHYEPVYTRSLHHGLFVTMGHDGLATDSGTYVNGLKEGHWLHRNTNGEREEGQYTHGKRRKSWKLYNSTGALVRLLHHDEEGRVTWSKTYN